MDSILLNSLFEAKKKEKELFALAHLRSLNESATTPGLNELLQQWGEAVQDVEDKKVTLGIV